jgi:L-rhamnose-H+ transport protein
MNEAVQATTNPALGVLIFALGGLAGAVFYLPFKKVKNWAWESYWFIYAVFGLVLVPWILAFATSPNLLTVLKNSPGNELKYCFLCGAMWGVGGLTWGLMIRYLGVGLGLALGCGICSAAGTLVPKILRGEFGQLFDSTSGIVSFIGVLISLAGIVMVGLAGMSKEKELPEEEKKKSVAEYNFGKGILAAAFSGLMSSGMGWGLVGGPNIQKLAESTAPATSPTWSGMPVLVVVLLGGFAVNAVWCLFLNMKNKTTGDYVKSATPLIGNFIFAGIAGAIWCSQFIAFKTGEPAMGKTAYVGWALLMACQILFSSLIGVFFIREWKGTSGRTKSLLTIGLSLLILTTVVSGYGGYLGQQAAQKSAPAAVQEMTPPAAPAQPATPQ